MGCHHPALNRDIHCTGSRRQKTDRKTCPWSGAKPTRIEFCQVLRSFFDPGGVLAGWQQATGYVGVPSLIPVRQGTSGKRANQARRFRPVSTWCSFFS
eukprot:scaffold7052_cov254-Pinguiococcus_pyrenoidosus.AAC.73